MAFAVAARYFPAIIFIALQTAASMARDKFYITTPIFYPNGKPHIGHAYTVDRDRRAGPLPAARRQGRFLPVRHRRARPQDAADGRPGRASRQRRLPTAIRRSSARWSKRLGVLQRRVHPHHRGASLYNRARRSGRRWRPTATSISAATAGWYSVRQEAYFDEKETTLADDGVRRDR